MSWEVGKDFCFPELLSELYTYMWDYSWFCCEERFYVLPKLKTTGNVAVWRIFPLDSQTLNKISVASTYYQPTSKLLVIYHIFI
jgi:hypothetical protein